ncbi:MAG: molybdenum cofactor biosynthesis protein MoaE [Helicobacteraceae bacterium]|jgi:molybdopterin synthase catalytic subunit|nr:molybdenum cofactor biosynthesis protein MoaE [Helicobacteraceae bacterium]
MADFVEIFKGAIKPEAVLARWYGEATDNHTGAFASFIGIVRDEGGISALSFDIYRPLLDRWFIGWQNRVAAKEARLFMAHSEGDVPIACCSYVAAIASPKRRAALEFLDEFVEDFKQSAPIWKYDVIRGKRVYAEDRSRLLNGAGLLGV